MVELLIGIGVEVNPTDRWGFTPLDDACRSGNAAIISLLRKCGARSCGIDLASGFEPVDMRKLADEINHKNS